jgi:hypothetical protein
LNSKTQELTFAQKVLNQLCPEANQGEGNENMGYLIQIVTKEVLFNE